MFFFKQIYVCVRFLFVVFVPDIRFVISFTEKICFFLWEKILTNIDQDICLSEYFGVIGHFALGPKGVGGGRVGGARESRRMFSVSKGDKRYRQWVPGCD